MTAAPTETPKVAPFEGIIDRLGQREADARLRYYGITLRLDGGLDVIDDGIAGMLGLARGAVFVPCAKVRRPFLFIGNVNGRRSHVVVAREYGDVSWPAYLARQRRTARDEGAHIVRRGLSDVRAWLDDAARRRRYPELTAILDQANATTEGARA